MSTLHHTPPDRQRIRARPGTALSLTALAIGLALLILMPTGHRTSAPTTGSVAQSPAQATGPTAPTPAPTGCFRDPATHALACYRAASVPTGASAPASYFRDPVTHKLLGKPARRKRVQHRPSHPSSGGVAP